MYRDSLETRDRGAMLFQCDGSDQVSSRTALIETVYMHTWDEIVHLQVFGFECMAVPVNTYVIDCLNGVC